MGQMSKKEAAEELSKAYYLRMKKRALEGIEVPPSDEKGKYYSWKYDAKNGKRFFGDQLKEFERLKEKYEK